jgi:3-oxoacyl-[acyl-carrier protein] reductase
MTTSTKIAIVTGASRGIGAAIAARLGEEGYTVVVNYATTADAAAAVAGRIEAKGGTAVTIRADVADAAQVARMFDRVEAEFGGIDVLINNAGMMQLAPIAGAEASDVDRQIDINLKGSLNTMREAAARLRSGGRIVNLSTSVLGLNLETYGVYAATKAAVETLTRILSKELRGREITVNAVAPGPTATDLFLNGKSDDLVARMAKMNPLERLGTAKDIAAAVSFLVGPDGAWINGQVLRANGGMI